MLQLINDNKGNPTGVFIPISEWNALKEQFPLPEPWDESIPQWQKDILDENNSRIQKAFEAYVNDGNYEAKPYLLKSIETQKSIRIVDAYIDSMKVIITRKTEGLPKQDTSQLRFMDRLDDYDTPTYLLIGSDETNPINTKYSAKDLRLQLTNLHTDLLTLIDNMQKDSKTKLDNESIATLKQKLNTIKPIDRNMMKEGVKLNWELENFYHMPMAAVITNLDKIQADMKNLESEFLHTFAGASSKFVFKIPTSVWISFFRRNDSLQSFRNDSFSGKSSVSLTAKAITDANGSSS